MLRKRHHTLKKNYSNLSYSAFKEENSAKRFSCYEKNMRKSLSRKNLIVNKVLADKRLKTINELETAEEQFLVEKKTPFTKKNSKHKQILRYNKFSYKFDKPSKKHIELKSAKNKCHTNFFKNKVKFKATFRNVEGRIKEGFSLKKSYKGSTVKMGHSIRTSINRNMKEPVNISIDSFNDVTKSEIGDENLKKPTTNPEIQRKKEVEKAKTVTLLNLFNCLQNDAGLKNKRKLIRVI